MQFLRTNKTYDRCRYSVQYTLPASIDSGANVLPNVDDPEAKVAQNLCPGYKASNVEHTEHGLSATLTLAGPAVRSQRSDS